MGWLWLALIAAVTLAALWRLGVARDYGWMVGSALMLGAAGYAWQQHAGLPGHPVSFDAEKIEIDPGLVAFRSAIMPGNEAIFAAADEQLREGDTTAASGFVSDAIAKRPGDAGLWAGLGSIIAAHDGGQLSPAALFAFRKAVALDPQAPGPPFLLGLAYLQSGQLAETKVAWLSALSLAPRAAPYRVEIAERLVMIDQFMAMQAGQQAPAPGQTGG